MMVDTYEFGHIVVDGQPYDHDVLIFPRRVRANWWRREGHRLGLEDLKEVLEEPPAVLVIGTGYYARMVVSPPTLEALRKRGIDTRVLPTRDAVEELNRLQREMARVVGALHLTC